ncbi:MAG TPA: capsule assembly Wzi family protein [Calditrichia bacterium]|nr:capsule assembly Wzi family protein [Calditrichia bacterium]HQV31042.1 capsule assembly Wzi family protein [Calditrichia bacterium]
MIKYLPVALLTILLFSPLQSQTTTVPLSHWVYDLLERWETKGLVDGVYDHAKPYTRSELGEYLSQALEKLAAEPERFSKLDLAWLARGKDEFAEELAMKAGAINRFDDLAGLLHLNKLRQWIYVNNRDMIDFQREDFSLIGNPIAQLTNYQQIESDGTVADYQIFSNGMRFRGHLGPYIGYQIAARDNSLSTDGAFERQEVIEESGLPWLQRAQDGSSVDFDETASYISAEAGPFFILWGRDYNTWGSGRRSQLLLSENSPIYDQLKIAARYGRFKLSYMIGFMEYISEEGRKSIKSTESRDSYWAGTRLDAQLGKGVQLGLAQVIKFGDRSLEAGYLNPLAFFKSLEHFYGDRDNGLISADLAWRIRNGIKWYGEILIDDLTTSKIGTDWFGNKFGFTTGLSLVDPLNLAGVELLGEYSRVKPYVYTNTANDVNKYKHYDTVIGHFIGPNSDDIYTRLRYQPSPRIRLEASWERIRHGSNEVDGNGELIRNVGGDPDVAFGNGDKALRDAAFLEGVRFERKIMGLSAAYEALSGLYLNAALERVSGTNIADSENLIRIGITLNLGQRHETPGTVRMGLR